MGFKSFRIKTGHQLRAFRYMLFHPRKIYRFLKKNPLSDTSEKSKNNEIPSITAIEANERLKEGNFVVLDVRGKSDFNSAHIDSSIHIEFTDVLENISSLPKDKNIGVICYGGGASQWVTELLIKNGFNSVNIEGGIIRWALDVDESFVDKL